MLRHYISVILTVLISSSITSAQTVPFPGYDSSLLQSADTLSRYALFKMPSNPGKGFNFEYMIYLPKGLKLNSATTLLVECNNTGLNDTIAFHESETRITATRNSVGNFISRRLKLPFLIPVFPRSATNWTIYTHALDRDAILSNDEIKRLDLQLLAMIEDAREQLAKHNIKLQEKFFITGFSASGTFANRMTFLHPEKIKATSSGGINAMCILPVDEMKGKQLKYPLGTADYFEICGKKFNQKMFLDVPQMLYMGELDDNDAVAFDDAYGNEERELVYQLMGKQLIPDRWKFMEKVYSENKANADFRIYPQIGHGTDMKIKNDMVEFFRKYSE